MYTGSWSVEVMEIEIRKNDADIHLLELSGALDLYGAEQLKQLFMRMIENKVERFFISLREVDFINSSGIGALIFISSTLKKLNGSLVFIVPEGPVLNALEITRLKSYFTIAPSLKEALKREGNGD